MVSLVVYMLLAAILTFGQLLFCAETLQQTADVAAREIARTPLLATANLMDVLYSNAGTAYSVSGSTSVRASLFDPNKLQFDLSDPNNVPSGQTILDVVQTWPIINQLLYPAMIVQSGDQVYNGDPTHQYLHFPGAVPCSDNSSDQYASTRTVWCVAEVTARQADGTETIKWRPVIEEMQPSQPGQPDAFSVSSSQGGVVSLRINYGYQSAAMSAYQPQQNWPPEPNGPALTANDAGVTVDANSPYTPTGSAPASAAGTYSGQYGLGTQYAWGKSVRPFRSLISAQAIYRREVFQ